MSAICYLFGRGLHAALGGETPIGLVHSMGGTQVQSWMTSPGSRRSGVGLSSSQTCRSSSFKSRRTTTAPSSTLGRRMIMRRPTVQRDITTAACFG